MTEQKKEETAASVVEGEKEKNLDASTTAPSTNLSKCGRRIDIGCSYHRTE
jgi:hypothetical protein